MLMLLNQLLYFILLNANLLFKEALDKKQDNSNKYIKKSKNKETLKVHNEKNMIIGILFVYLFKFITFKVNDLLFYLFSILNYKIF